MRGEFSLITLAYNLRRAVRVAGVPRLLAALGVGPVPPGVPVDPGDALGGGVINKRRPTACPRPRQHQAALFHAVFSHSFARNDKGPLGADFAPLGATECPFVACLPPTVDNHIKLEDVHRSAHLATPIP